MAKANKSLSYSYNRSSVCRKLPKRCKHHNSPSIYDGETNTAAKIESPETEFPCQVYD